MSKPHKITEPFVSHEALDKVIDEGEISVIVEVSIYDLTDNDTDEFDDLIESCIIAEDVPAILADISYSVVGHTPPAPGETGGMIHIRVDASVQFTNSVFEADDDPEAPEVCVVCGKQIPVGIEGCPSCADGEDSE